MNENQFFDRKPQSSVDGVFAADTRHSGVIHARTLYLLMHDRLDEARALVESRRGDVQASTYELLAAYVAKRALWT